MPRWTKKRQRAVNRRADGTFKPWTGGKSKSQLKKKKNNFQGIAIHIGNEFKKQNKRTAKVGDTVRTKRKDGQYHKGAFWYIKTKNEWRKSPTETRKPTSATIKRVNEASRPGRPGTPRTIRGR